jgi:hypothetical protein
MRAGLDAHGGEQQYREEKSRNETSQPGLGWVINGGRRKRRISERFRQFPDECNAAMFHK